MVSGKTSMKNLYLAEMVGRVHVKTDKHSIRCVYSLPEKRFCIAALNMTTRLGVVKLLLLLLLLLLFFALGSKNPKG